LLIVDIIWKLISLFVSYGYLNSKKNIRCYVIITLIIGHKIVKNNDKSGNNGYDSVCLKNIQFLFDLEGSYREYTSESATTVFEQA